MKSSSKGIVKLTPNSRATFAIFAPPFDYDVSQALRIKSSYSELNLGMFVVEI